MAAVTIGYGDGVPRGLQSGAVLLHGQKAPILGRICMDQLMVAADAIPAVQPGDAATLIGRDGAHAITAIEVEEQSGSIVNEVLERVGGRVAGVPLPPNPAGQKTATGVARREKLARR